VSQPGLYIHIPFCISKCPYCAFYSVTGCLSRTEEFLAALRQEMALSSDWTAAFDTLYIGGGTPSVLFPDQLTRMIADARRSFFIEGEAEITVEANPADITIDFLEGLLQSGVNRISMGVQSFNDALLSFLGRRHKGRQAEESVQMAQKKGFDNISLDLIYGIPGQDMKIWEDTLRRAVSLRPSHLSCYQLTVEKGTPLHQEAAQGRVLLPDENSQAEFFFFTSEFLQKEGYLHYEVSNFALPGHESRHNRKYWDHTPYLGLGPSAHSFRAHQRHWNISSVDGYSNALTTGHLPIEGKETLNQENLRMESLFLGFRTRAGICLQDYNLRFGGDLLKEKKGAIDHLVRGGFLEIKDGFLRPAIKGMAIADSLALL
jgi:oxygen-independent coproporphyrinogen-3 oxidase